MEFSRSEPRLARLQAPSARPQITALVTNCAAFAMPFVIGTTMSLVYAMPAPTPAIPPTAAPEADCTPAPAPVPAMAPVAPPARALSTRFEPWPIPSIVSWTDSTVFTRPSAKSRQSPEEDELAMAMPLDSSTRFPAASNTWSAASRPADIDAGMFATCTTVPAVIMDTVGAHGCPLVVMHLGPQLH